MTSTQIKTRNHAIDLMKFLAAVLITNSHMDALYPGKLHALATGGAIGDALFFFCSGFLLMMGRSSDFFNWYKRRINRIFPTIFAVAIISIVVFGRDPSLKHVILNGGGWFVQAIFVFYAIFWFVKRFLSNRMWIAYLITSITIVVWFSLFWDKNVAIFGSPDEYLRWPCFFMVMLLGGTVYNHELKRERQDKERGLWVHLSVLAFLLLFYFGFQWIGELFPVLNQFQIIILLPLMGIVFVIYKICSSPKVISAYLNKYCHLPLYYISACCLEIYLCQKWCFGVGIRLIRLFPLNVLVTFLLVFVVAYLTKVFSNFLSQTFKSEEYNWRGMVKL